MEDFLCQSAIKGQTEGLASTYVIDVADKQLWWNSLCVRKRGGGGSKVDRKDETCKPECVQPARDGPVSLEREAIHTA